ncbi:MAG: hypothetical protein PHQ96_04600 [Candidatus Omnitrophica bacterium]|nr:hypothetical protein [Candidatus Omnitrophota bacterium]
MSIIYEALQKIEKKEGVSAKLSYEPRINTPPAAIAKNKAPSWMLSAITLFILLLAALYMVRLQPQQQFTYARNAEFKPAQTIANVNSAKVAPAPTIAEPIKASYTLQGIIYDELNPIALINGIQVKLGDRIGDAVVLDISSEGVKLEAKEGKIFLPLQ